ncbi:hypothetical protein Fbal_1608 [Ferrimonas balearica DSM 9799]|uniref:Lipoprotein n=2 Tax=Ferrimonas balearica TaxID=44012 RepID=E1SQ17_FERBD|nr:hypothetical protein Fbal_1608 [Ferrimonas balearica DSM 9799]
MKTLLSMACVSLLSGCSLSIWSMETIQSWSDARLCQFHTYFAQHQPMQTLSGEEIARRQAVGSMSLSENECQRLGRHQQEAQSAYSQAFRDSKGLDRTRL